MIYHIKCTHLNDEEEKNITSWIQFDQLIWIPKIGIVSFESYYFINTRMMELCSYNCMQVAPVCAQSGRNFFFGSYLLFRERQSKNQLINN